MVFCSLSRWREWVELNKKTKKKQCYTSGEEGTRESECISEGDYSADNLILQNKTNWKLKTVYFKIVNKHYLTATNMTAIVLVFT